MGELVIYHEERSIDHLVNKYLKTGDCGIVVNHATSSPTISKTIVTLLVKDCVHHFSSITKLMGTPIDAEIS